jgi:hypothetical protein
MPQFMKVATTSELEDQQAKLVEIEGRKIALSFAKISSTRLRGSCSDDRPGPRRGSR